LKRRNVVKVAVAYAIVGWLLVQIADTFFPALQLPEWTVTLIAGLVILGFPIALILSWAYELTPDGMKRSREVEATESIIHVTGRKLDFAIIGALVVALGFVVYNYVLEDVGGVLPNSVAVLPFENLSPDPDNAYFAAGIHEEILNQLAKLSALNVIARTSVLRYADGETSILDIARELNVETIMEGSVRYADDQVRVVAQLIDPETGAHLWSDVYQRDFADIFAIQADIAMNIANALEAEFSDVDRESIAQIPTNSPVAYALYLRSLQQSNYEDRHRYLDQAISIDPDFAFAHARKAWLYALALTSDETIDYEDLPALEDLAYESAERAFELDPNLGRTYRAISRLHVAHWRGASARVALERAYELSPNDASVVSGYSTILSQTGDADAAIQVVQRAIVLDPNNRVLYSALGATYFFIRDYDAAAIAYQQAIDLDQTASGAHMQLALVESVRGNVDEALRELSITEALIGNRTGGNLSRLAYAYSRIGRREKAVLLLEELQERSSAVSRIGPGHLALAHLAAGNYEESLLWYNTFIENRDRPQGGTGLWPAIKANIFSDPVLERPEFQEMRSRLGFTDL